MKYALISKFPDADTCVSRAHDLPVLFRTEQRHHAVHKFFGSVASTLEYVKRIFFSGNTNRKKKEQTITD